MPYPKRIVLPSVFGLFALAALSGCQMMSGHAANNLGSAYYREGQYAAARLSFQQAVAEMPENPDFRYNLAAAMQKQGDLGGAEQIYRHTLYVDPSHQPSYHGLAQLMIDQGRQAEATGILNSWVATQPYSAAPHIEMAWLQQQQGNQFAAAQSLETALKLEPNHSTALAQLGQVYQESGQPELAAAYYQRSLDRNWRQPEVQTRLAAVAPSNASQRPTQVAFGMPNRGFGQPIAPQTQMAFAPQNLVLPTATMASAPFAAPAGPPMTAATPFVPAQPAGMMPQVQTAWFPPQSAPPIGMTSQPMRMARPMMQPTPVPMSQFNGHPMPTFATAPINADPAHVPQMTAELPVVQPY